jgi:6-pyruvoyltetrahydropterin/6-carboxytetrahydropterin synthase
MHTITITRTLWAAHAIRLPDGTLEPRHSHNWIIRATLGTDPLPPEEWVMDFHALEGLIDRVLAPLNNRCLNDLPPYAGEGGGPAINPTAERFAQQLATQLAAKLPDDPRLLELTVTEAPGCDATWIPE